MGSFGFGLNSRNITEWKSTGIYNHSSDSSMNAVANTKTNLRNFKNDGRMHVHLNGNHFQQIVAGIPNNDDVINIYCVYQLDQIASTRDSSYAIQNVLFGAMQITKNATDYDKNNYKGYGICFDISLHYNGDDSYLFVNGRQELKFKCKTDQLVKKDYA